MLNLYEYVLHGNKLISTKNGEKSLVCNRQEWAIQKLGLCMVILTIYHFCIETASSPMGSPVTIESCSEFSEVLA